MTAPKSNAARRRTAKPASSLWLSRVKSARTAGPLYLSIASALAQAIEAEELAAGDKLPPQRAVARELDVDLTTVTRAYAQARAMGLLEGETGRGTFVRGEGSPDGPIIDLSMNMPPAPADASMRDLLKSGLAELLKSADPTALMTYRAGMGSRRDRAAGASWLAPCIGEIAPQRVLLAPGAQAAISALLPLLAGRGDVVLAEPFTYPGFIAASRLHGVRVAALTCDAEGPVISALEKQCRAKKPCALYLTPTLQNPTTRTMSEARRRALAGFARKYDLMIIEDDAYGALLPDVTPLARLAPERVFHISTLSKCLSPGLRTAFVVAPEGFEARVSEALRAACQMPTPLLSDLAVRWIESGVAQRLCASVKAESASRMKLAKSILPTRAKGGPVGFHLWMEIPTGWTLNDYMAAARAKGVAMVGADEFAVAGEAASAVRVSLGAAPNHDLLAQGLKAICALEDGPAGQDDKK